MSSVGVFREEEIDGNPFHKYFGDLDLPPLQPLFLCPSLRLIVQKENYTFSDFFAYKISPHFHNTDQQVQQQLLGSYRHDSNCDDSDCDDSDHDKEICKLPVVPIFWCNSKEPDHHQFSCGACIDSMLGTDYYLCPTCNKMFHKECVESPLEIKHPSYPLFSLQLYHSPTLLDFCICCKLVLYFTVYHCPTYNFNMHPVCALKPIPIVIDHPKSHPHPLTLFPKQASLLCDVCGLTEKSFPTYVCARCVFVVHQCCIYIPHVIKIPSRHQHRISFIPSLPSGKWSCGVCRKKVDNSCGAYSCCKCSHYFVHTRCALRSDIWDGVDLEGVPEEPDIIVEPFETIADGIILHFTHSHHLKLEISRVYNDDKFCQACILPIYEGNYYSCMDRCDFVFHEACAHAPRKIHHALHLHPLTLKISGEQKSYKDFFKCYACFRYSYGFVYEIGDYRLDIRCALVSEPFEYKGHEHPLFLALDQEQEWKATCQICQEQQKFHRKLNCIECEYVICFKCATLPYRARYKHDKHFLTFQKGKEGSDQLDWCEVCERKIVYSNKDGFYECHDCCITLHVHCLLGREPYMQKPGQTIMSSGWEYHILPNNTQSRPFCYNHDEDRCPHKVVFKWKDVTFCSYRCDQD
ncbi:hypothetical protein EUTSA_v10023939mg [Eutrema salsugineum]|uniref:Zinc finger PHD-type domain-containing protein n=1 Tax=Eutrema salsugineum TaxID=72664 RepID=V4KE19_EUTSA|nr:uncharacterized protein LOC18010320 [Eutrema salsugineum]ESQ29409.1 hypothetical protein EUTSA_v10023939mg [Eutrema salsugineum]